MSTQALIPRTDGLHLRLLNHSPLATRAHVALPQGWSLGHRIDFYGQPIDEQPSIDGSIGLAPWCFATIECQPPPGSLDVNES